MSRIGKKPIPVPQGVKVQVDGRQVRAEGPKGKLVQPIPEGLQALLENNHIVISRGSDERQVRALRETPRGPAAPRRSTTA